MSLLDKFKLKSKPKPKPEIKPKLKPEIKPKPKPEIKPKLKPEIKPEPLTLKDLIFPKISIRKLIGIFDTLTNKTPKGTKLEEIASEIIYIISERIMINRNITNDRKIQFCKQIKENFRLICLLIKRDD